jgi:prepilin-type N-terminal cleavage/methylation domain-containing protein
MKLLTLMTRQSANRCRRGMTLLELMVSMSILTVIILGLYSMFEQTQKALLRGAEEVDVQEIGRSAFRVILSQVDEVAAAGVYYAANSQVFSTNFYVAANTNAPFYAARPWYYFPNGRPKDKRYLQQDLIGGETRQHQLQDFFFLTREGLDWKCTGYFVRATAEPTTNQLMVPRPADAILWQQGVGSLYRFEMKTNYLRMDNEFLQTHIANFFVIPITGSYPKDFPFENVVRVADGIIHLRVGCYTNGVLVPFVDTFNNITLRDNDPADFVTLTNGQSPSHITIEMGVLEPKTLGLARAIPGGVGASNILRRAAGNVLMFRARVPVRTRNDRGFK